MEPNVENIPLTVPPAGCIEPSDFAVVQQPKAQKPPSYEYPETTNDLDQQDVIQLQRKDEHPPTIVVGIYPALFTCCHNFDGESKFFDITRADGKLIYTLELERSLKFCCIDGGPPKRKRQLKFLNLFHFRMHVYNYTHLRFSTSYNCVTVCM